MDDKPIEDAIIEMIKNGRSGPKPKFIQIGMQKCGTTFMSDVMYPANPNISFFKPDDFPILAQVLLRSLIMPDRIEFNNQAEIYLTSSKNDILKINLPLADALDINFASLFKDETKVNGIMFEHFTFLYQRSFDRLNAINRLKGIYPDIKIITCIRNQSSWLLSHYSQYIKSGGLLSLYDFIECQLLNDYLDLHYVDWYPLINVLYKTFGKENVLVCVYEELAKSPQKIADIVFSFLGVPTVEIGKEKRNPSLSSYTLLFHRIMNHFIRFGCGISKYSYPSAFNEGKPSRKSRLRHQLINWHYREKLLGFVKWIDRMFKFKKTPQLCDDHKKRINERYSESNKKVSELLLTDLSEYGYFENKQKEET